MRWAPFIAAFATGCSPVRLPPPVAIADVYTDLTHTDFSSGQHTVDDSAEQVAMDEQNTEYNDLCGKFSCMPSQAGILVICPQVVSLPLGATLEVHMMARCHDVEWDGVRVVGDPGFSATMVFLGPTFVAKSTKAGVWNIVGPEQPVETRYAIPIILSNNAATPASSATVQLRYFATGSLGSQKKISNGIEITSP